MKNFFIAVVSTIIKGHFPCAKKPNKNFCQKSFRKVSVCPKCRLMQTIKWGIMTENAGYLNLNCMTGSLNIYIYVHIYSLYIYINMSPDEELAYRSCLPAYVQCYGLVLNPTFTSCCHPVVRVLCCKTQGPRFNSRVGICFEQPKW